MDKNELELEKFKEEEKTKRMKHLAEGIVLAVLLIVFFAPVILICWPK